MTKNQLMNCSLPWLSKISHPSSTRTEKERFHSFSKDMNCFRDSFMDCELWPPWKDSQMHSNNNLDYQFTGHIPNNEWLTRECVRKRRFSGSRWKILGVLWQRRRKFCPGTWRILQRKAPRAKLQMCSPKKFRERGCCWVKSCGC